MIEAMLNGTLQWQNPQWFWGVLLPLLIVVLKEVLKTRQKQSYADSHLWAWVAGEHQMQSVSAERTSLFEWLLRVGKVFSAGRLVMLGWLALMVALAGPRSLDQTFSVDNRHGVDVMIDIDLSQSMKVEDVNPSRFVFARTLAESVANELKPQDRIALNVFAGQAHAVVPFTHDKLIFQHALKHIYPGLLPTKGSWHELALVHDLNLLSQTGQGAKVLLVLTDGAPPFWKSVDLPVVLQNVAANQMRKRSQTGVKVIYVGIGLNRSGSIPDSTDKTGQLHVNGLVVQSRLEERLLQRLAEQTEGLYLKADTSPDFMRKLMDEITQVASLQKSETPLQVWHDYAAPFVWLALISLLFAFYGRTLISALFQLLKVVLSRRINRPLDKKANANQSLNSWMMALVLPLVALISVVTWSEPGHAASNQSSLQQAHDAFAAKDYESAESLYDGVSSYAGYFGAGSAAYRLNELESAVLYFREAAWQARDEKQRARALYNLGNSYYKANLLTQAIEAYQQALLYQSPYSNAEHNLALAKERLKLEMQGKLQQKQGSGEGQGAQGKDAEGAFYGGQKPNPDASDDGAGAEGDGEQGERHGEQINLPDADPLTDYQLNPSIAKLRLNSQDREQQSNSVLRVQRQKQRAEQFEHALQKLEDDQSLLLKRMFEREEGFEAAQEEAHPIPGVQPW